MKLVIALPLVIWSVVAQAFDWSTPVAVTHQGEPLEVRLEVTNLAPVSATQLFPLLASETAFTERGIDRPEYLSGLTYAVDTTGGRVALVIRTATAWTQPDLTTLVEVFTPAGPVLIPVSVQVAQKPTASSVVATEEPKRESSVEAPVVSPAVEGTKSSVETEENARNQNGADVVKPRQQTLLVQNGSTLWRLAKRVQPPNLTIEQVMMALYDENPGAFEYNNVNALEKGKTLVIPSQARMEQESALNAKQRFDAHMKAPKQDFPRTTPSRPQAITATPEPVVTPAEPEVVVEEPAEAKSEPAPTVKQDPSVRSDTPTDTQSMKQEPVDSIATLAPQVVTVITPEVTELLEKITSLESKLDAMDAKVEAIRSEAKESRQVSQPLPQRQMEQPSTELDLEEWLPTREQIDAFFATELGKGVLIFVAVVILMWLGLRVYGRQEPMQTASHRAPSAPPLAEAAPAESLRAAAEIQAPATSDVGSEALESAIERLKSKIEDPAKFQEAEELYSAGDDSLIDAFSADALNQNPEWGEDPDDEADVAAHQLELAQNYLDMGMTQTAIELLQRVSVSPDQASAEKARALLDVHQS
jgi:FimV-like protein